MRKANFKFVSHGLIGLDLIKLVTAVVTLTTNY